MPKLNTLSKSSNPSVMLFGLPFTGKSLLAGKLAEHFNLLYIDMENGHDVLFTLPEEWQERIDVIELRDTSSYPIAIETCLKMVKMAVSVCHVHGKCSCAVCKRAEVDACKSGEIKVGDAGSLYPDIHSKYFTDIDLNNLPDDTIVIFDSSTQLTASALANITKKEDDMYKLERDDWGGLAKLMEIFYSHIQNGTYKRIVISHVTEAKQDDGKTLLFPVAGSRNFSANVGKFFDHVIYLERKNKKHMAASATDYRSNILTGSRTNVRLEDMDDATLLSIFKPEAVKDTPPVKKIVTSSSVVAGSKGTSALLSRLQKVKTP